MKRFYFFRPKFDEILLFLIEDCVKKQVIFLSQPGWGCSRKTTGQVGSQELQCPVATTQLQLQQLNSR
jgi:hypothetical protein